MKILINDCHGGFGLNVKALLRLKDMGFPVSLERVTAKRSDSEKYVEIKGKMYYISLSDVFSSYDEPEKKTLRAFQPWDWTQTGATSFYYALRSHPLMIQLFEEMGQEAGGSYSALKIVEIPDEPGLKWEISEYDGAEWVQEKARKWH